MKICINCKENKEFNEFGKRKDSKDGYRNTCNLCRKEQRIIYYEKNKDKIKEKSIENRDMKKEYNKKYKKENKAIISEYNKNYKKENKDVISEYNKEYYKYNKEHRLNYAKDFRSKNREKLIEYDKKRYANNKLKGKNKYMENREENMVKSRERRKNDLNISERDRKYREKYKYIIIWRSLLRNYLVRINKGKKDKTINLLGYTHEQLKFHIEKQFVADMCWDNYGEKWQIDHIIQIFLFKEDTPANIVNSLENLRPLDKFKNLSRGKEIENFELIEKFKYYLKHNLQCIYNL